MGTPFCSLCGSFIYVEGGSIGDSRVCKPCVESLAEQASVLAADDDDLDEFASEIEVSVSNAVQRAVDNIRRDRAAAKKRAAA